MTKEISRLVKGRDFHLTDEEHRLLGPRCINIWYGYNTKHYNVAEINSIAEEICNDFPVTSYSDIQFDVLTEDVSFKHSGQLFLKVCIQVDQFLNLRKNKTVGIL